MDSKPDTQRALAAERERLVADSDAVRRTAGVALGLMTALVLVGGLVISLLVRAEESANRLNSLSEAWAATVQNIEEISARFLDPTYRSTVPAALLEGYEAQLEMYFIEEARLSNEIEVAIQDARSPLIAWLPVIPKGMLSEYEHSELNAEMLASSRQMPGRSTAMPEWTPSQADANRRVALEGRELSQPARQREVLGQSLFDHARSQFIRSLAVVLGLILVCLVTTWLTAFWPALTSSRQLTLALERHAAEIAHSYLTITAAQRVAKLGYWYRRGAESVVHCSPEFGVLTEREPGEVPKSLPELAALSAMPTAGAALIEYERLAGESGNAEFTRLIELPEGESLTVRERVESIDADGTLDLVGVMLDITEITTAQQVIHRMERLEMVDLLVSGIAHDFNNLLAIVLGNAEVARLKTGEAQDRHLESIIAACETASSLIEQLRHTTVEPTGPFEEFNPAESVLRMADAIHEPPGVQVVTVVDAGAERAVISANRGLFESSLINVIDNAFDALGTSGGRIGVTVRIEEPTYRIEPNGESLGLDSSTGLVSIEVRDDGPGMSEEVRRRALQPFFSTKSETDATHSGLGLWSVFAFTRASGGDISIESIPGRGTSVRVVFPCVTTAVPTPASGSSSSRPQLDIGGAALLVEDEPGLRALIAELLEANGVEVEVCGNFDDAIDHLQMGDHIGLLVSDVHLGAGPTGIDLARAALELENPPGVVLISGAQRFAETPADLRGERCWFVPKPCSSSDLLRAISMVTAGPPLGSEAANGAAE